MLLLDPAFWSDRLRQTLARFDEPLLRLVAGRLLKPRGQWPCEELIDRMVAATANIAIIDRRLKELDTTSRRLLAAVGLSRQPRWKLGNLVEMSAALGHADPLAPLIALLHAGIIFPDLVHEGTARLNDFEHWLGHGGGRGLPVFAHPQVTTRCLDEDLGLPSLAADARPTTIHEADGLDWPLRLAALWQLGVESPFRRTQQGDYFKRDLDRLTNDGRLGGLALLPDAGLLVATLAALLGVLVDEAGELRAGVPPGEGEGGLFTVLESLWAAVLTQEAWDPHRGSRASVTSSGNPYPSALLLTLLLLARLPAEVWARTAEVEQWVIGHHPYWPGRKPTDVGLGTFLIGLASPLCLVEAGKDTTGEWLVRLAPLGRSLFGAAPLPPPPPEFRQTLLVQPNLEIVAYRQGLTLPLLARLTRFAQWTSLGAACTLRLQPESVYRALESGQSFEDILQTLERHGMRPTPPAVVEALRTWASKRERLTVFPAATLFEFTSAEELNDALARGLPAEQLTDRLALVADESAVEFRHFRLTSTRDYALPPEKCVEVEDDGITLALDWARSDLFLEAELRRFAEPVDGATVNGRRRYRVTRATLEAGRAGGLDVAALDDWFARRTGMPLSPACRLLLTAAEMAAPQFRRRLVLKVMTPDIADGLCQWPGTRGLIEERLGPTTLAIDETNSAPLRMQLEALGVTVRE